MKHKILFTIILLFTSFSHSQDDFWQISFNDGRVLSHIKLNLTRNDSVAISWKNATFRVSLHSVDIVRKIEQSSTSLSMKTSGIIGCISGLLVVGALRWSSYEKSNPNDPWWFSDKVYVAKDAVAGGIVGGLAGMIYSKVASVNAGHDEVYNFGLKTHTEKVMMIRLIERKMKE